MKRIIAMSNIFFVFILLVAACSAPAQLRVQPTDTVQKTQIPLEKTKLVVFAAGSLIVPFQQLELAFEAAYPQIDLQMEYHGSIQVIRHVTELHEPIDVVATADANLIPQLMFAVENAESGTPYANWMVRFAGNELALAYQEDSLYAADLTAENWAEVLSRPDVRLGLSDPRFDALGYRALMVFALQEALQRNYKLFSPMFQGQFTLPISTFREENSTLIHVPEILETTPGAHILMRGASIQLVALLESKEIDYAFEYESVIRQRGLNMFRLPEALNLRDAQWDSFTQPVEVKLDFKRFANVQPQFRTEHISYGITIPSNAPHAEAAALFVAFLLGEDGRAIMEKNYQPIFPQPVGEGYQNMPPILQEMLSNMDGS